MESHRIGFDFKGLSLRFFPSSGAFCGVNFSSGFACPRVSSAQSLEFRFLLGFCFGSSFGSGALNTGFSAGLVARPPFFSFSRNFPSAVRAAPSVPRHSPVLRIALIGCAPLTLLHLLKGLLVFLRCFFSLAACP